MDAAYDPIEPKHSIYQERQQIIVTELIIYITVLIVNRLLLQDQMQ